MTESPATGILGAVEQNPVAVDPPANARLLARLDYLRGRERHVWDMVASTKNSSGGADRLGAGGGE